jgi:hypothetical protein
MAAVIRDERVGLAVWAPPNFRGFLGRSCEAQRASLGDGDDDLGRNNRARGQFGKTYGRWQAAFSSELEQSSRSVLKVLESFGDSVAFSVAALDGVANCKVAAVLDHLDFNRQNYLLHELTVAVERALQRWVARVPVGRLLVGVSYS